MSNQINTNGSVAPKACNAEHTSGARIPSAHLAIQSTDQSLSGDLSAETGRNYAAEGGVSSFQKIYNKIALSNKAAQQKNEFEKGVENPARPAASAPASTQDENSQSLLAAELLKEMGIANPTPDEEAQLADLLSGTSNIQQANQLVQQAISVVSQTLNLKTQNGLENINLNNPSQNVVDQFAQIISALKGIASVLDQAVAAGQPVEYGATVYDPQKASDMEKTIQEQLFNIEMALKLSGMSGEVANGVANLENAPVPAGITQATNPALLSTPAIYVRQILGQQLATNEQKLQGLFSTLVSALQEKTPADSADIIGRIVSVATGSAPSSTMPEAGGVDGQVLRKLLNIDESGDDQAAQPGAAAPNQNNSPGGQPSPGSTPVSAQQNVSLANQNASPDLLAGLDPVSSPPSRMPLPH